MARMHKYPGGGFSTVTLATENGWGGEVTLVARRDNGVAHMAYEITAEDAAWLALNLIEQAAQAGGTTARCCLAALRRDMDQGAAT